MNKNGKIDKLLLNMAFLYLMFPITIFFVGWCKLYIGIPLAAILVICFYRICKKQQEITCFEWGKKDIEKVAFIVGIIALWVYFSGIGGFVFQNTDHDCRNAIFEILVKYDWPVVKEMVIDGVTETRGLIYYIGFWLPPALIGKLFGVQVGYCAQAVWAVLGIFLFYYLVCVVRKKIEIWPLVVFVFMSGLDIWGYYLVGKDMSILTGTEHLEWWTLYQYSSFTTQLFWVFNQAIPAWIAMMLIYLQKNNKYIVLLLGCTLLSCTLPFVGMLPFVLYFIISRKYEECKWGQDAWWKNFFKDTFTFENVVGGGISGIISFLYLIGNSSGQIVESSTDEHSILGRIMLFIVFIIVEVGVYWIAVYKYEKRNPLFYIAIIWLCICPWIQVGSGGDFCMRASIPAIVLLYLFVVQTLEKAYGKKDYLVLGGLLFILLIGSTTPRNEIHRTITETRYRFQRYIEITEPRATDEHIFTANNFSGRIEKNIFFRYLVRIKID